MAVYVRHHDDQVTAIDQGLERSLAPTRGIAAVRFEGMSLTPRNGCIALLATFDSTDQCDVHMRLSSLFDDWTTAGRKACQPSVPAIAQRRRHTQQVRGTSSETMSLL
jgi:hypothetical protein